MPIDWTRTVSAAVLLAAQIAVAEDTVPIERAQADETPLASLVQSGPATISLGDQAALALPDGYAFLPREPAAALMESMGNLVDERFLGLVLPASEEAWFVSVQFDPSGYIEDDDASEWDADHVIDEGPE